MFKKIVVEEVSEQQPLMFEFLGPVQNFPYGPNSLFDQKASVVVT
jgi:hypothetical protein